MSFVLNDSIYLHKAPKQWEILNQSERYVRSILVAEIELEHSRSNENVIHDLAHLINLPDLKIGGIRRQKSKRQKTKRQKSKRQKIKTKKRRNAK
jgi:predicted metallopeptidase